MSMWSTLRRGEPGYDEARRGLSASAVVPDLHPRTVVRVGAGREGGQGAEGVRAALAAAEREGLRVTVRSGGHSASFAALRNDVVAIDVRALDGVEVDPVAGTAVVGPGTTSLAAARALHGTGWSFPVGHRATVGLGGFLLAGGNGWNHGVWGSACESVLGADVVLADGRLVHLDAADPAAYAALRGAGPGFPGVVTAFHLRLWPEQRVQRRILSFPAARAAEVGAWADHLAAVIDPAVELTLFLAPPDSPMHPDLDEPALTVAATAYADDPAATEALLAPVDETLPPGAVVVLAGPSDIPTMVETETAPPGLGVVAQQAWTTEGYAAVLPDLAATMTRCPSPWSSILVSSSSYRRAAPPATDTAYLPLGTLTVAAYSNWRPGDRDEDNRRWAGDAVEAIGSRWSGHYVGELDLLRRPDRLAACFPGGGLARIDEVRRRLDPAGRFADFPGRC
ncbi:FAD-binding protein [Nocardioides sp. SOB77]|uniref:FAD-binding protein n=1 Tax=Nocardioides oceani TaxID=3058369 RepID=A0ABT8FLH4_9ACTN|nr:FAD-binding protein [Nocardioides oceani]MDN4175002.1 FAD-binding protein [Nocardioides oceani]